MNSDKLKRNLKLWFGIIFAIFVYYVVHEGTHFIQAVLTNNLDYVRLVGLIGIEIKIKEVPTGISLALFSGLSNVATVVCGYILVIVMPKILKLKHKIVKVACYYITIILLALDPIYMSILHRFVGGGDMNGITNGFGISSLPISIVFGILAIINVCIIMKKVHPAYKYNFD